jgi:hypothetical protein
MNGIISEMAVPFGEMYGWLSERNQYLRANHTRMGGMSAFNSLNHAQVRGMNGFISEMRPFINEMDARMSEMKALIFVNHT